MVRKKRKKKKKRNPASKPPAQDHAEDGCYGHKFTGVMGWPCDLRLCKHVQGPGEAQWNVSASPRTGEGRISMELQ